MRLVVEDTGQFSLDPALIRALRRVIKKRDEMFLGRKPGDYGVEAINAAIVCDLMHTSLSRLPTWLWLRPIHKCSRLDWAYT